MYLTIIGLMTRHVRILSILVGLALSLPSWSEYFKYNELQIKDYDEMLSMVRERIKKSNKILKGSNPDAEVTPDQESVESLRQGLLLVLSRPNQDNMLAKLMPEIRKELNGLNAFEDSIDSLAQEALDGLNNTKLPVVVRSTYWFVLENILSEFKPEIRDKEDLKKTFVKIRDAKIEIPKDVKKDLKLRSMFKVESPSDRAKRILEALLGEKDEKKN